MTFQVASSPYLWSNADAASFSASCYSETLEEVHDSRLKWIAEHVPANHRVPYADEATAAKQSIERAIETSSWIAAEDMRAALRLPSIGGVIELKITWVISETLLQPYGSWSGLPNVPSQTGTIWFDHPCAIPSSQPGFTHDHVRGVSWRVFRLTGRSESYVLLMPHVEIDETATPAGGPLVCPYVVTVPAGEGCELEPTTVMGESQFRLFSNWIRLPLFHLMSRLLSDSDGAFQPCP